jgi:hypothetical protein
MIVDKDKLEEVESLLYQGEFALKDKDYQNAFVLYVDALKKAQEYDDEYGISQAYTGMGHILSSREEIRHGNGRKRSQERT